MIRASKLLEEIVSSTFLDLHQPLTHVRMLSEISNHYKYVVYVGNNNNNALLVDEAF